MVHELIYDDDNQVAVLTFKNNFMFADVEPIFSETRTILNNKPYRQLIVVMSTTYHVENRETREATAEELSKMNMTEVAFVGGSAANRMIARVLIKTGLVKLNGDFFKTYEEAVEWLKSKR